MKNYSEMTPAQLEALIALPRKTCPKCSGKGHIEGYRQDMGRCYRCEGLGQIATTGQRVPTKRELKEATARFEWAATLNRVRAEFRNDPRLPALIAKYEKEFEQMIVFTTPDQAALSDLYQEAHGEKPWAD